MMLHLIERAFGEPTTANICEHAQVGRMRGSTERQRLPLRLRAGASNETVIKIVEQMERYLARPLPLDVIAARVDRSRRQIERLFVRIRRGPRDRCPRVCDGGAMMVVREGQAAC
jgi:transcriptional regulator GlxA family with amidase domain